MVGNGDLQSSLLSICSGRSQSSGRRCRVVARSAVPSFVPNPAPPPSQPCPVAGRSCPDTAGRARREGRRGLEAAHLVVMFAGKNGAAEVAGTNMQKNREGDPR
jgi:hypothetical protein